jgi:hypothetical protein
VTGRENISPADYIHDIEPAGCFGDVFSIVQKNVGMVEAITIFDPSPQMEFLRSIVYGGEIPDGVSHPQDASRNPGTSTYGGNASLTKLSQGVSVKSHIDIIFHIRGAGSSGVPKDQRNATFGAQGFWQAFKVVSLHVCGFGDVQGSSGCISSAFGSIGASLRRFRKLLRPIGLRLGGNRQVMSINSTPPHFPKLTSQNQESSAGKESQDKGESGHPFCGGCGNPRRLVGGRLLFLFGCVLLQLAFYVVDAPYGAHWFGSRLLYWSIGTASFICICQGVNLVFELL